MRKADGWPRRILMIAVGGLITLLLSLWLAQGRLVQALIAAAGVVVVGLVINFADVRRRHADEIRQCPVLPPPGWYPDPEGWPGTMRWWDGQQWTERTTSLTR